MNFLSKCVALVALVVAATVAALSVSRTAGAQTAQIPATTATKTASEPAAAAGAAVLLVLNKADNTLAIVDPVALKVVARVAVGEGPHEVVASSDGRTAYVANYGTQQVSGSSLSIIDIAARREKKRVDLGALRRPHGIVEAGGKIYFTAEANRAVARYDPATDRVDWLMGTGESVSHMLVITPDAKRIYTANMLSNTVTALNVGAGPTPQNITQIAVGKTPEGIGISPDGREVWAANRADGTISVIDTTTNKVLETIAKFSQFPFRVAFTPDGRRVLIPDPMGGELIVFDAATRKETGRIKIAGGTVGVAVSADGRRAYVCLQELDSVAAVDLEKMEVVGRVETGKGPDGIAWAQGRAKS
ncbi:MAG TPA: beta-propeller fold lactonase family protein [Pyrinomonadaceae bacterium]|nr:beta-propeller fold lactonase family protein [Pyrinomonadaceae bacterium]